MSSILQYATTRISHQAAFWRRASPSKLTAVHVFRIRRLQSEIIFTLYASGRRRRPSPEWMDEMQRSIEEWYAQRPKGTGFCSGRVAQPVLSSNEHASTSALSR